VKPAVKKTAKTRTKKAAQKKVVAKKKAVVKKPPVVKKKVVKKVVEKSVPATQRVQKSGSTPEVDASATGNPAIRKGGRRGIRLKVDNESGIE
jgi:hypothetical protein